MEAGINRDVQTAEAVKRLGQPDGNNPWYT